MWGVRIGLKYKLLSSKFDSHYVHLFLLGLNISDDETVGEFSPL